MSPISDELHQAQRELHRLMSADRFSPETRAAAERVEELKQRSLAEPRNVYVPLSGTSAERSIHEGSGVVGEVQGEERILVYYQDDGGYANIKTFADRVSHAAGRLSVQAPTSAKASYPAETLARIGSFDPALGVVTVEQGAEAVLARWLKLSRIPGDELLTTEGPGMRRRMFESALRDPSLEPAKRQYLEQERRRLGL